MSQQPEPQPALDSVFDVLADEHRRQLLRALLDQESPDGAVQIPRDIAVDDSDRRFEIRLHHVHLPKLEATEIVEHDGESNVIRRGPAFEEVRPLLEALPDRGTDYTSDCA